MSLGLLGRHAECDRLDGVVAALCAGKSQVLVLRGEPGVGKSALLDYTRQCASGARVLQTLGVETETELAFAAVHQLCFPLLDGLPALPAPLRTALETVFGIDAGPPPDDFLTALAALNLMTHAAADGPLFCVVDDAQWLDQASAQVLAFVARRLLDDPIAFLFATREPVPALTGLPELTVTGLDDEDAYALLDSVTPAGLDPHIRDRVVAEAHGNPLAVLDLPHGLAPTEMANGLGLLRTESGPGRLEQSFLERVHRLSASTQLLLLVAAAEPSGDPQLVREAVGRLGVQDHAALADEADGLLEIDGRVTFRHPLARAAAYRAATPKDRRAAHRALAAVTDPSEDADRRAWHRAAAASGPDESVAVDLERAAPRAQSRAGVGAAAALLQRSVVLTQDLTRQADRALSAADASLQAGDFDAARHYLDTAARTGRTDWQLARLQLVRGQLGVASGRPRDAGPMLLAAARQLQPLDMDLARETYLSAWGAAVVASDDAGLSAVCLAIEALPEPHGKPSSFDLPLRGCVLLERGERAAGVAVLQRAAPAVADLTSAELLRWGRVAAGVGSSIWDDDLMVSMFRRQVQVSREAGALRDLSQQLNDLALATAWTGDFPSAQALIVEAETVAIATGTPLAPTAALWLAALVGHEDEACALVDSTTEHARDDGQGRGVSVARWSSAVLFNGLGRYAQALVAARSATVVAGPWTSTWALAELLEAAVRMDDDALADDTLGRLTDATQPCETDWALGILARCRALVSATTRADELFVEAIERLGRTHWRPEVARAHLLYGEWLRRQGRRVSAREHLRLAHDLLAAMGMEAFAERARRELMATGEKVRKRSVTTTSGVVLTPQEMAIATLVRDGYSNPEVGSRLFLSPRTVEWHLRKVFSKLSISSRKQLVDVLLPSEPVAAPRA